MNRTARILLGIGVIIVSLLNIVKHTNLPFPSANQPQVIQSVLTWYWQDIKKAENLFAPKLTDFYTPSPLPFKVDLNNLPNYSNYKIDFNYIPHNNPKTLYYDKDGNIKNIPSPNGYYRKILGKTTDNKWVAQDFYQETNMPQTSIFKLATNSNYEIFDTEITDGSIAFFDKNGNLNALGISNLQHINSMHIKDKRIIAQTIYNKDEENYLIIFFDNNQNKKAITKIKDNFVITYFLYPSQQLLLISEIINEDNQKNKIFVFDKQGYPLSKVPAEFLNYVETTDKEIKETLAYIQE